jgi:hypothetical protein
VKGDEARRREAKQGRQRNGEGSEGGEARKATERK